MSTALTQAQRKLNVAKERARRARLGPPLSLDDAHLTALSEVGPHDQAAVESFCRDSAGQIAVDLLRAKREA